MMPPLGTYPMPRADAASRNVEAARYARNEYGSSSLAWMVRARSASPGLWVRFTARLGSAFGRFRARPAQAPAHPASLRTGVAAVHFAEPTAHPHDGMSRMHAHPHWDVHATTSLLLPALEPGEKSETCECDP